MWQSEVRKRRRPTAAWISVLLSGMAVFAFGYAIYMNGLAITGPFIFGDELEYFAYGRDLWRGYRICPVTPNTACSIPP
jgi:hypothetical protein